VGTSLSWGKSFGGAWGKSFGQRVALTTASLNQTLDPATLVSVGVPTPATATLVDYLAPAILTATGVLTSSTATLADYLAPVVLTSTGVLDGNYAAPTFNPIVATATARLLKATVSFS
jgi:hypothetical protein